MLLVGIDGTFGLEAGSSNAMKAFSDTTGTAVALSSSFRFLFSSIVGMVVVITKNISSNFPSALSAILFSIVGLILFLN
ncbi:hypothetical protein [Coxiella-like endosymbiont of Rhipicephalus sanguineus]|uniref:hypothetical protein n=1 Tax=Coxiella-like endosymbiont of Rhipicephalus sanguineus TaxID=1955402 RepID=UPI002041CC54|nr:hypothetical protein [Coxiella-like endosymbiont of Rhipicephalus sanguineus]